MSKTPTNQTSLDPSYTEQELKPGFSRALPHNIPSSNLAKKQTGIKRGQPVQVKKFTRFASLGFNLTTQPQQILPQNMYRTYLLFQNKGTGTIYLSFGTSAQINGINTVEISAGGNYELDNNCPINDVSAVSDSTAVLSVQQGVRI